MCWNKRGSVSIEGLIVTVVLLVVLSQIYLFLANHTDVMKLEIASLDVSKELTYKSEGFPSDVVVSNIMYHGWLNNRYKGIFKALSISKNVTYSLKLSNYNPHLGEGVINLDLNRNYIFFSKKSKIVYHFKNMFKGNGDLHGMYVYVTNYGEKYHKGTCWHLYASKIPLLLKEALNKGYEACLNCGG